MRSPPIRSLPCRRLRSSHNPAIALHSCSLLLLTEFRLPPRRPSAGSEWGRLHVMSGRAQVLCSEMRRLGISSFSFSPFPRASFNGLASALNQAATQWHCSFPLLSLPAQSCLFFFFPLYRCCTYFLPAACCTNLRRISGAMTKG